MGRRIFLAAILNRMVDPKSEQAMADWCRATAVGALRPVDIDEPDSGRSGAEIENIS